MKIRRIYHKITAVLTLSVMLTGTCSFSARANALDDAKKFLFDLKDKVVIAVCPEVMGGLPTPRVPSEIVDGIVMNREGKCVDREFRLGTERIMQAIEQTKIDLAILQPRSPSCGVGKVYDGTFSGRLTDGMGIFAQRLQEAGIPAVTVEWLENKKEGRENGNTPV